MVANSSNVIPNTTSDWEMMIGAMSIYLKWNYLQTRYVCFSQLLVIGLDMRGGKDRNVSGGDDSYGCCSIFQSMSIIVNTISIDQNVID